jgi:transposase
VFLEAAWPPADCGPPTTAMPRVAPAIKLEKDQEAALQRLIRAHSTPRALATRATIVLRASRGESNRDIAAALKLTQVTVGKWRHAFATRGMAGLRDKERSGRPRKYSVQTVATILDGVKQRGRRSQFGLSVRALAREFDVPRSTLYEMVMALPQQAQLGGAKAMDGRAATQRRAELAGIYISRPLHALVIRVRPIALDLPRRFRFRAHVMVDTATSTRGRPEAPTLAIATALDDTLNGLLARATRAPRPPTLVRFLGLIVAATSEGEIHLITDRRMEPPRMQAKSGVSVCCHVLPSALTGSLIQCLLDVVNGDSALTSVNDVTNGDAGYDDALVNEIVDENLPEAEAREFQ